MIREFIKSSSVYSISSIIAQGLSFVLIPLYTRILNPSDYGFLDLVIVFATLVNLTVPLQISQGAAFYYGEESDKERRKLYSSSALWFTVLSYTVFVILTIGQATQFSKMLMGQPGWELVIKLSIIYIWSNGVFFLVQNQFRWELRSKQYVIVNLVMNLSTTGVSLWLAFGLDLGLTGMLVGKFVGNFIGIVFSLYWLRKSYLFRINVKILRDLLSFSFPLVIAGVSAWANIYIDRLIINFILTLNDVGIYGMGNRFSGIASTFMVGFQLALPPLIYNQYQESETPNLIAKIFDLYIGVALIIFFVLMLFIDDILRIMTTPPFYSAAHLIVYLVPAAFLGQMYIFAPGLFISKKTNTIGMINLSGAILNLALNLVLIPHLGIMGAAISTLVSNFIIFVTQVMLSQKYYYIPYRWIAISVMTTFVFIVGVGMSKFLPIGYFLSFVIKVAGVILFVFILNFFEILKLQTIKNEIFLIINSLRKS